MGSKTIDQCFLNVIHWKIFQVLLMYFAYHYVWWTLCCTQQRHISGAASFHRVDW